MDKSILEIYGFNKDPSAKGYQKSSYVRPREAFTKGNNASAAVDRAGPIISDDGPTRPGAIEPRTDPRLYTGNTSDRRPTAYQEVIERRVRNNDDTYIDLSPASGKTSPLQRGYYFKLSKYLLDLESKRPIITRPNIELFLRGLVLPECPRLLYIARTKQLASEGFVQNFRGDTKYGMIRIAIEHYKLFVDSTANFSTINRKGIALRTASQPILLPDIMPILFEYIKNIIKAPIPTNMDLLAKYVKEYNVNVLENYDINIPAYKKLMKTINEEFIALKHGESNPKLTSKFFKIKPIIISTPSTQVNSPLMTFFKQNSKYISTVILDESQQYLMKPESAHFDDDDVPFAKFYFNLVKICEKPGKCGMQILTGTTNIETSNVLVKEFNEKLGRNFTIPGAKWGTGSKHFADNPRTAEGNRSILTVVPFQKMADPKDITSLIVDTIRAKETGTLVIIFSTGIQTASGILRIASNVVQQVPLRYGKQLNSGTNIKTVGDVINLNDGDSLNKTQYAEEFIYDQNGNAITLTKYNDIEFLKHFSIELALENSNSEGGSKSGKRYTMKPDENSLLYKGVLAGVGFLFGGLDARHKATIQYLFRIGKIYCVMGTDAIGIGSNVLSKHMYLTALTKAPDFSRVDKSSLLQMIHRIGRDASKVPYAFIYVDPSEVDNIEKLLTTDPAVIVEPLNEKAIKFEISKTVGNTRIIKEKLASIGSKIKTKSNSTMRAINSWLN